jgi:hypothetical protein
MQGVLVSYDSDTGKEIWKARLGGSYSAAPIAYKGLAFFLNEVTGETTVVKPGPEYNVVAKNVLVEEDDPEEQFRSIIVPDDGQLLIRSTKALYCVGKK